MSLHNSISAATETVDTLRTKRVLLVLSRGAGGNTLTGLADQISGYLTEHSASVETLAFRRAETPVTDLNIPDRVVGEGYDVIVVAGGDGTIRAIAQDLWHRGVRTPIGIVPTGSANMLARSLHIPLSIPKSLDVLRRGSNKVVAAGLLNEQHLFFIGACFGHLARVTLDAEQMAKSHIGWPAYALAAVRRMWYTARRDVRLTIERESAEELHVRAHSVLALLEPSARTLVPPVQMDTWPITVCWGTSLSFLGAAGVALSWLVFRRPNRCVCVRGAERVIVDNFAADEMYLDGDRFEEVGPPYDIRPVKEGIPVWV